MADIQKHLYVLILCGGGGTRLWPQSRENNPKQFAKLFGGKSLFSLTVERARKITSDDHIFVVTVGKYLSNVKTDAPFIPHENIIAEPMRRDTAMAHGIGALYIYKNDPEAVIINLASDHLISPVDVFIKQMKIAAHAAFNYDYLVTVGIKPRFPHSGLGHIKAYKPWNKNEKELLVGEKFIEKPEYELAKKYTESGKYYWNANLYVFRAKLYLDLLKKHAPKTYTMYPGLLAAIGGDKEKEMIQLAYQMAPSISVDYAV
jgi:mannose-1-phosphate guanylyltransferase